MTGVCYILPRHALLYMSVLLLLTKANNAFFLITEIKLNIRWIA